MAVPNLPGVSSMAVNFIQPKLRNIVYGKSMLLTTIARKRGFRDFSGLQIQEPAVFKRLPAGAIARGGTVTADYSDPEMAFTINPKLYYANVPLLAFDGMRNDGNESSLSLAESRLAEADAAIGEVLGASLYFTGQQIAAYGADYSAYSTTGFWNFLDPTTQDTTTNFVDGLGGWLDDGNQVPSIGGQTRTNIGPSAGTVGGANAYVNSTGGAALLSSINTAIGKTFFQPQSVDTIAMGFDVFMYLINKIQPLTRFGSEDAPMAKLGFKAVMHAGVEYVADNLCPSGAMFGFDSDILRLWVSRRALGRFGFTGFKTDQITVGDTLGQVVFFGNSSYPVPRVGFRYYGLSS